MGLSQLHQAMLAARQMFVQAHELKELGVTSDDTYAIHCQEHSLQGIQRAGAACTMQFCLLMVNWPLGPYLMHSGAYH